jgi:hypothetical protein
MDFAEVAFIHYLFGLLRRTQMKFLTPVLLAAFLLVGCERIEGQLNITKELKLKNNKGDTHQLLIGTYSADIKANTSKKITLRLNYDSDEKFVFKHDGNIPDNGPFYVPSSISGQPVDLTGVIATSVANSETRETTESCSYREEYQVCFPLPQGGMSCSIQYRTVYGTRWIRYYDRQTIKNVNLLVSAANSTETSGEFHGDISYAERIIINQSRCR